MNIVTKTLIMMPVMFVGSYLYVSALLAVGRRVSGNRPKPIVALAGSLVWLAYLPFLLSPLFWLVATEISPIETNEIWIALKTTAPVFLGYLIMVVPGLYYIYHRRTDLRKYGYFTGNT